MSSSAGGVKVRRSWYPPSSVGRPRCASGEPGSSVGGGGGGGGEGGGGKGGVEASIANPGAGGKVGDEAKCAQMSGEWSIE